MNDFWANNVSLTQNLQHLRGSCFCCTSACMMMHELALIVCTDFWKFWMCDTNGTKAAFNWVAPTTHNIQHACVAASVSHNLIDKLRQRDEESTRYPWHANTSPANKRTAGKCTAMTVDGSLTRILPAVKSISPARIRSQECRVTCLSLCFTESRRRLRPDQLIHIPRVCNQRRCTMISLCMSNLELPTQPMSRPPRCKTHITVAYPCPQHGSSLLMEPYTHVMLLVI